MPPLISSGRMGQLLEPYLVQTSIALDHGLLDQLSTYLAMLVQWNSRTNLTSIRDPEEIVRRHLFGRRPLGVSRLTGGPLSGAGSLLDLGSGAGFPGVPIQLVHPGLRVTLAESQGKKAAFLREVNRSLGLGLEVWAARAETLPEPRRFDVVALRAVDNMPEAVAIAQTRATSTLCVLTGADAVDKTRSLAPDFSFISHPIPSSTSRKLLLGVRMP